MILEAFGAKEARGAGSMAPASGHEARRRGIHEVASTFNAGGQCGAAGDCDGERCRRLQRPRRDHQERGRGLCRPRQGYGPHLPSGNPHEPDGRFRRVEGDATRLRYASADRSAKYYGLRRGRRDQAHGRGDPDLHRLDVRREPRPSRRGASGVRCVADELQDACRRHIRGKRGERAGRRGRCA